MAEVMTWSELCESEEYRGRWVALDGCRYDETTAKPVEGTVIDVDDDVVELCNRVRDAEVRDCAILFIDGTRHPQPPQPPQLGLSRALH